MFLSWCLFVFHYFIYFLGVFLVDVSLAVLLVFLVDASLAVLLVRVVGFFFVVLWVCLFLSVSVFPACF